MSTKTLSSLICTTRPLTICPSRSVGIASSCAKRVAKSSVVDRSCSVVIMLVLSLARTTGCSTRATPHVGVDNPSIIAPQPHLPRSRAAVREASVVYLRSPGLPRADRVRYASDFLTCVRSDSPETTLQNHPQTIHRRRAERLGRTPSRAAAERGAADRSVIATFVQETQYQRSRRDRF